MVGIGCESIENQGPEAVHEGDLYVRQKRGAVCDMRALYGDAKDGDAQVMAKEEKVKTVNARA